MRKLTRLEIPFTKMQGVGNDYLYIDKFEYKEEHDWAKLSHSISNRHFGVGSDGLILIEPSDVADFRMRMFNSDGLEGEMCGNGLRCLARYVYDHRLTSKTEIKVETKAGIMVAYLDAKNGVVESITMNIGKPIFDRSAIPVSRLDGNVPVINDPIEIDGVVYYATPIKVGVPHCVFFVDDVWKVDLESIGPKLEHHPYFPERANINFVAVRSNESINMRIWERGSGVTLGSGTGSSASAVASMIHKKVRRDGPVTVNLTGGRLLVEWKNDGHIWQTGPAVEVCNGVYFWETESSPSRRQSGTV